MRTSRFPLSRRAVLRGLGVGAAFLPLLEATHARGATRPKRLVIMSKGGGNVPAEFWPRGEGTNLATMTFGQVSKVVEPFKDKLNFVGGLAINCYKGPGDGHLNYGSILTGNGVLAQNNNPAKSPSVDWVIGEALAKRDKLPFPTIAAGVAEIATLGLSQISWRASGQPNTADADPYRLFQKIFAGRTLGGADPAFERIRAENKSLLDFTAQRVESFGRTLGAEDRMKIDAHLTSVRSIEKQVMSTGGAVCTAPTLEQPGGTKLAIKESANVPKLLKMQVDIVMAALRCDLTRVATINIADTFGDGMRFEWLGLKRAYHGIKHKNGQNFDSWLEEELKVEPWLLSQFAYLLGEMKAVNEGGTSMLDSSVAFWCDALSNGTNHAFRGMPWILAGSCGGYFKTGQLLRYGGWATTPGEYWKNGSYIPHNALLVSLANAMEVPMASFGDPAFGTGELPGLKA
jgi:hypothetical protein